MKNIILFYNIIIPGNVELLLNYANSTSNFGLYGLHLKIYYTRNLFYFFTTISILFYSFHYYYISYYFMLFGLINHIHSFYKWNKIIIK